MKIIFSPDTFNLQKFGGISRYFTDLISMLIINKYNVEIPQLFHRNHFLNNLSKNQSKSFGFYINLGNYIIPPVNIINYLYTIYCFEKYKRSDYKIIFHNTYYSNNVPKISNLKNVVTVYDMIHENLGDYYGFKNNLDFINKKKLSLELADHIIAISNTTKKEIIRHYNISEDKISVIHLNASKNFVGNSSDIKNKKNHILYVGNRAYYKNFILLLECFKKINEFNKDIKLIVYGGEHKSDEEMSFINKNLLNDYIFFVNGDSSYLNQLYRSSKALVFPSLEEGFGIPILEAISSNCIPICSNINVFKEIGKNKLILFDLKDKSDLIKKILYICDLPEQEYKKQIDISKDLLDEYTLDKMLNKTLDVYRALLN